MPPVASISSAPSGASSRGPTAAILSPVTSTSASVRTVWASSMVSTVPPRSTTGRPAATSGFVMETSGCRPADDRPLYDHACQSVPQHDGLDSEICRPRLVRTPSMDECPHDGQPDEGTGQAMTVDQAQGPLAGLLVADFSRLLAAPYATMLLADLARDLANLDGSAG